jgi:zinc/manganese transport system substrate-binding protein
VRRDLSLQHLPGNPRAALLFFVPGFEETLKVFGTTTLVGPDGDAHVYSPTPADAKRLAEARVVFINGIGFEGWMDRLVKASGTKAPRVTATRGIKTIRMEGGHSHGHGHNHGHSHAENDPHAWQSVGNAKVYVNNIRDALIKADPAGKAEYEANAKAYIEKLDALDKEIRAAVNAIPKDRRKVITSHDAFGYFKAAYGVDFIAPQGVSTDAEASAQDVARIGHVLQEHRRNLLRTVPRTNATCNSSKYESQLAVRCRGVSAT